MSDKPNGQVLNYTGVENFSGRSNARPQRFCIARRDAKRGDQFLQAEFRGLIPRWKPDSFLPLSRHNRSISAHVQGVASLRASLRILVRRLESRSRRRGGGSVGGARRDISSTCWVARKK